MGTIDVTAIAERLVRLITDNRHNPDLVMMLTAAIDQSGAELGCVRLVSVLAARLP